MKILSSLHLLAALGALGAAAGASAQVDTSQWKCTSCPYPKGTTGSVDGGVGYVGDSSMKFGDYTGLDEKGRVPGPRRQREPPRRGTATSPTCGAPTWASTVAGCTARRAAKAVIP